MTATSTADSSTASTTAHSTLSILIQAAISLLILGAAVAIFILIGPLKPPPSKPDQKADPLVQVQPVEHYSGGIDFVVDGVVIPFREIEVPTEVAGRVQWKSDNCRVGHTVREGEPLVRIDTQEYELELRQIAENVKQARANLQELEVQIAARKRQIDLAEEDLDLKRREVQRYASIDDPGVYSKSELDAARLKELQARDALQTERDQLELLEASRNRLEAAIDLGLAQQERANLDLSRTQIVAPIDGIVTQEGPEQGGFLQRGGTVVVVQDTSRMEIRCSLPMRQMSWLWQAPRSTAEQAASRNAYQLPENPATVRFDTGAAICRWEGKLAYFDGGRVDQQTRMVPCRVVVRKPKEVEFEGSVSAATQAAPITLLAGMFVSTTIHANPGMQLLRMPKAAVQPGNHVWLVRPGDQPGQGRLHQVRVNVAHMTDEYVLAYQHGSDLKANDLVVVSPLASPTEDATVEVAESP